MKHLCRALWGVTIVAAVLAGFSVFSGEQLTGLTTVADPPEDDVLPPEETHRTVQVEPAASVAVERTRVKDRVVDALLAGKLTLFEAAAWFRSMYADPHSWVDPYSPRPGREEGERWCRLVIDWTSTKAHYDKSPREGQAVRQRLEDELQEHLRYHRTVVLPD